MKKIVYILLLCFLFEIFSPIMNVLADVTYPFQSGTYHVVWINNKGESSTCGSGSTLNYDANNIEYIKSFDVYNEALSYMNTLTSTSDKTASIIGEKLNKNGTYTNSILYSQYGLVDLNTTGTSATTSNVYTTKSNRVSYTYINGNGMFGAVDAALIDYSNDTKRVNMKIAGIAGWIDSLISLSGTTYTNYEIVPLSMVKSPSYYFVNDSGELVHRLSRKVSASDCYTGTYNNLGPAPSSLVAKDENGNMIKYYSYDGNYFYKTLEGLLDDYKNSEHKKAVNSIPYYNYYMYLPIRSKTNMASDDIRAYLESRNYKTEESSALYGEELTFLDAQNKYGVNGAISFATAINESAWGASALAKAKNNIFGHNAIDSAVMSAADGYNTVSDGIYRHAYYLINAGFSETKDAVSRYYGSHIGNKESGMNVKYASDPYWGEKIASHYYSMDNFNGLVDYYKYTIGIKTSSDVVNVKSEPNNSSTTLYKLESYSVDVNNMSVIILERVTGESIDGNNIWYKIQSDALLTSDRDNVIQDTTIDDMYDWNKNYAYVHSSFITLMDESVQNLYTKKDGIFGLENMSLDKNNEKINIKGYLAIEGMDNVKNKTITYDLVLENQTTAEVFEMPLDRVTDINNIPFVVTNDDSHDYTYSWFNSNVSLSGVAEGDYTIYVRARSGGYEAKEILSNKLSRNNISKYTDSDGRGYHFRTNYYLKTIPIELFIRDDGLISDKVAPTIDNMFNQYQNISLSDGKLNISGQSFNIGGNYSKSTNVERKIVFENTSTFERLEYDLGYSDSGEYAITLVVPDNLDKTRGWFNNKIDVSTLEKGNYAIYIKTKSTVEDYGELNDIFSRSISSVMSVNSKNYSLKVNEDARFRIELLVK